MRRGRRKKNNSSKGLQIYYNNINGYQSKEDSIKIIMQELSPDILALCETKRPLRTRKRGEKEETIPGYDVYSYFDFTWVLAIANIFANGHI